MSNTTNLQLPYLAVGQAQKHVTVNETLRTLDALVQLSVVSATTTTQPASPADGEVYIVPPGKSGADWNAYANWALGYYRDGAWVAITPREGWLAVVRDSDELLSYSGSAWVKFPASKILVVSATDKVLGRATSGAGAAEEIACTAAGRALIDDADAAAQRTTLGLAIGTDVQAYDAELAAIAGLASAANKAPYFTGSGAAALCDLTAAGRALIDDADAAAQRTTLGLGTAAVQNTGTSGANVPLLNASNTWSANQVYASASPGFIIRDTDGAAGATTGSISWQDMSSTQVAAMNVSSDNWLFDFIYASADTMRFRMGATPTEVMRMTRSTNLVNFVNAPTVGGSVVFHAGASAVPGADNTRNLGSGSFRFATVYAGTGTINTSDAREKTALRGLSEAEGRAIRRVLAAIGVFQWRAAIAEKGPDASQGGARLHVGVTAQALAEAFAAEGLDPARYALWCADAIEETYEIEAAADDRPAVMGVRAKLDPATGQPLVRHGVRYDQLFAMALAAMV